jgi:hypothetical protein
MYCQVHFSSISSGFGFLLSSIDAIAMMESNKYAVYTTGSIVVMNKVVE